MPRNLVWWQRYLLLCGVLCLASFKFACQEPTVRPLPDLTDTKAMPIINGAPDLDRPAIGAMVVRRANSFCTGTLITKQLVVTAAHCVDAVNRYGLASVQFRVDVKDANQKFTSTYYELLQVAKHPNYTSGSGASNDIAVLVLKKKAQNVTPIPINTQPMDQKWIGTNVRVVGYGLIQTQPQNRSADQKYAADIPLFQIKPNSFIHFDGQTPKDKRKSACHGDSGGPALYTVGGLIKVLGVTSIAYQATPSGSGQTLCDGGAESTRTDTQLAFLQPYLQKYSDGPQACKTDTECGLCGLCGQKNICEPKPITKEAKHCQPCKADADCGGGVCYRFDSGYRCLQACNKDNCCPADHFCTSTTGTSKSSSACVPTKDTCPDVTCQVDGDCGPGEKCDTAKKTCVPDLPPRSTELCLPCSKHSDCGKGLCLGPQGNGRCSQPCGTGDFCPDGFTCQVSYPGLPKQCVSKDGTCRLPCELDDHCPKDFACTNKYCSRKGGGTYGDPCDPMPCATGFKCTSTTSGKVCLQECGVKAGYAGTACLAGDKCNGGVRCYKGSSIQVCIGTCKVTNDCKASGGGTCTQLGNCICRRDSECETGSICNYFTYDQQGWVGACVPEKEGVLACPSQFSCSRSESGESCVKSGGGSRAIGEACDSANSCRTGLRCMPTSSGGVCVEDCTQTQQCKLGGSCLRVGRTTAVCLCQGNNCPSGKVCKIAIQGYGYCTTEQGRPAPGCTSDQECPGGYRCDAGKCVEAPVGPEPTPEPPPVTEPVSDAGVGPEPKPEPPAPGPEPKPEPSTPKPDVTTTPDVSTNDGPKPPGGGCGCQASVGTPASGSMPFALFLLAGLGFFFRRKRYFA